MSTSSLYDTTTRLARKHSKVSLLAAGAATAGLLGGVCTMATAAPWDQAIGNMAKTVHDGSQTSAGTSGPSSVDMVLGVKIPAGKSTQQSIGGHGSARLSVPNGSNTAKPAAAPAAAPARAAAPAKAAVKAQVTAKTAAPTKTTAPAKAVATAHVAKAAQHHAAARPAQRKANPAPSKPYLVYDSVTPNTIPSGKSAAVYANGSYATSASSVAGHHSVLWIDTNGSDPNANVLDVEPGDATPAGAAQWVSERLSHQPHSEAIVYTMMSDWQAVKDDVGGLPSWMQSHVRYWIADPTGVPHVVPGSSATQWYWGSSYDISTANPNFEH